MRWRKKLATLSTFALATTAMALGPLDAADAATNTVVTPMSCIASTPIGNVAQAQDVTVTSTAPDGVENGDQFTISNSSPLSNAPADAAGYTINQLKNIQLNIPIPANSTYVSHSLGGDGVGTLGSVSLVYNAGQNRMELLVPGPIAGGAPFKIPTINIVVQANGPTFSQIVSRLSAFSTTVNVQFPDAIGGAQDVVANCTPVIPVPALSTTTIIPPDVTAPTATITVPGNGAVYGIGQTVNAAYTCSDPSPGSGVASCVGTVPVGQPIDTSSLGVKSFSVTATDNKSNSSVTTVNYTVADVPTANIHGSAVAEGTPPGAGGQIAFDVTLNKPSPNTVTLDYSTSDGTAVEPGDYALETGTLTFLPGGPLTQTVLVDVVPDADFEQAETVSLVITDAHGGASIGDSIPGRIVNDDAPPVIVSGGTTIEGSLADAVFTVVPSEPSPVPFSVAYTTTPGTAGLADYTTTAGVLSFGAGDTTPQVVNVPVVNDVEVEDVEDFTLDVTQYNGDVDSATGTIEDNDPEGEGPWDLTVAPTGMLVGDATVYEGNSGSATVVFPVTLRTSPTVTVKAQYRAIARTATAGNPPAHDFAQKFGTVTFKPGQVSKEIAIKVHGDTVLEPDEHFIVQLYNPTPGTVLLDEVGYGTIRNDEGITYPDTNPGPAPIMTLGDGRVWEPDTTLVSGKVNIRLDQPAPAEIKVKVSTVAGTAGSNDYVALSGKTVTFKAGQQSKAVDVKIKNDPFREGDETFSVVATPVSGTFTLADATSQMTILDDDFQPTGPTNVAATPNETGLGLVTLTWDPPAPDALVPVLPETSYDYRVSLDGGTTWGPWAPTGTGADRSLVHSCGEAVACSYQVRAWNARGPGAASTQADAIGFEDTVAPEPLLLTPLEGANRDSWSLLSYRGDLGLERGDSTTATVEIVGPTNQTLSGTFTGGEFVLNAPPAGELAPGLYTVTVEQTDWSGNVGTSTNTVEIRNAVFVSDQGNDANPGTAASPKETVQAGVTTAAGASRPQVAVGYGAYDEGAGVTMSNGVSLSGGFNQYSDWQRPGSAGAAGTPDNTLSVVSGAPQGVLASGAVTASVDGLSIQGRNTGLGAGASVYGVRAVSGPNLTLTNTRVSAEAGLPGSNGASGANGADGSAGAKGITGWEADKYPTGISGPNCSGSGTAGATGPAGGSGAGGFNGGKGGDARCDAAGTAGTAGASGGGTAGGGGSRSASDFLTCNDGGRGGAGGGGAAGSAVVTGGAAGNGGTASATWDPAGGGSGTAGSAGRGGGGGGAGGGARNSLGCGGRDFGGTGGSGGGAGGGGAAGNPGTGGGSSFGIYVFDATVTVDATVVITAANGGVGGNGGAGGNGGNGGTGGQGGSVGGPPPPPTTNPGPEAGNATPNGLGCAVSLGPCYTDGGPGGGGGGGGGGSAGSGGGGGAGGRSVAIYHAGTGGVTGANLADTTKGTGGAGGLAGGFGQASQPGGGGSIANGAWTTAPLAGAAGTAGPAGVNGNPGVAGIACRVITGGGNSCTIT